MKTSQLIRSLLQHRIRYDPYAARFTEESYLGDISTSHWLNAEYARGNHISYERFCHMVRVYERYRALLASRNAAQSNI